MPNWCYTHYTFDGNANDIEAFHNNIEEWTSVDDNRSAFGESWLGNLVEKAGFGKYIATNCPEGLRIRCRGSISDIGEVEDSSDERKSFSLSTETAWYAMPKIFFEIIEKFEYNISVAYQVEECGMGIYEIYDPDNLGCYDDASLYLDLFINDNEEEVFEKYPVLKELSECNAYWNLYAFLEFINKYGFISVEHFNDFFGENLDDDDFVVAHKFEYIDEVYE